MRVLLVSGSLPPNRCGVGDYTFRLRGALEALGTISVGVLTTTTKAASSTLNDKFVYRVMKSWKITNLFRALKIIYKFRPDIIHFQYPTQGYDGRLSQLLPVFCKLLSFKVVQTWHEHYKANGVNVFNALACDALVYARPDFETSIPHGIRRILKNVPRKYIANAATIPAAKLSQDREVELKRGLAKGRSIICFFGFAHVNKGVERLFEIINPVEHQLLLMCDLNPDVEYQKRILELATRPAWSESVSIIGYQPADYVGEVLAISEAVIFPFPKGAGEWNTSLKAAQAAGVFCIATTTQKEILGYDKLKNTCFVECANISGMRECLSRYIGTKSTPVPVDEWGRVAKEHEQIYKSLGLDTI